MNTRLVLGLAGEYMFADCKQMLAAHFAFELRAEVALRESGTEQ